MSKAKAKTAVNPNLFDVILRPVVTEKSSAATEYNKLTFVVKKDADKGVIKSAIEQIFGVKVADVNTVTTKGKSKRFKGVLGKRSDVKKAIVTLGEGETIDLSAGVK
jgi:large subunit ribosomal protein L23